MIYAPFVVPTLCRSEHFIRMMESLKRNSWACHTDVIVSVDSPPSEKYQEGWQKICDYLDYEDFSAFNKLIVFKQTKNLGSGGNTRFLYKYVEENYDRWIQCDDDCEFSPNFLEYMDKCLHAYEDDPNVIAVTGYSYPVEWNISDGATCMKQQFNVATWGLGRWVKKNALVADYIRSGTMLDDARMVIRTGRYKKMISKCFVKYFDEAAASHSLSVDLMRSVTDISLRAYLACQDKYCVSPVISKVRNYGFDGSGLFCQNIVSHNNSNARNYDYPRQVIDGQDHFDIVLNDPQMQESNRMKLDEFDCVSKKSLQKVKIKFLLIKYLGVGFTRNLYGAVVSFLKLIGIMKKGS